MNDRDRTIPRDHEEPTAASSGRRIVGVVRVLRGKLGAPCRACSEASAEPAPPEPEDPS